MHEVVLDVEVEQVKEQGSTRHGRQLVPLHVQLAQVSEEEKYMGLINTASPKINVHNKEISITLTLNDKLFYCRFLVLCVPHVGNLVLNEGQLIVRNIQMDQLRQGKQPVKHIQYLTMHP